jgi:hypothetical protein
MSPLCSLSSFSPILSFTFHRSLAHCQIDILIQIIISNTLRSYLTIYRTFVSFNRLIHRPRKAQILTGLLVFSISIPNSHHYQKQPSTPHRSGLRCLPPTMASSDIYRELLLKKQHGLPLWKPDPDANLPEAYTKQGISIGDLGLLTVDGGFDYLCNVHADANDPVNQHLGTPDFFIPLPHNPATDTTRTRLFHPEQACITRALSST